MNKGFLRLKHSRDHFEGGYADEYRLRPLRPNVILEDYHHDLMREGSQLVAYEPMMAL